MEQCTHKLQSKRHNAESLYYDRYSNTRSIHISSAGCELVLQQSSDSPFSSHPADVTF